MKYLLKLVFVLFLTPAAFAEDTNFADLYEKHSDSVVTIYTATISNSRGMPKAAQGVGSGVLIENDQIMTAAHVVDGAHIIDVLFTDGKRIKADVIASLDASDVALLQLRKPHPNPTVAVLADSDLARVGSKVFIIGSPFGISQTLSVGHLSGRMNRGLLADGASIEFLQTDTAINKGNSGGPMFNTDGEVIGIVSFILTKSGGFDGIGFATASNTARQALMESSGVLAGFEGVMLDDRMAQLLNLPGPGMLVQRVVSDSILGKAGLKAGSIPAKIGEQSFLLGGDYILEINGIVCRVPHDFDLVRTSSLTLDQQDAYAITIYRDGGVIELLTEGASDFSGGLTSIEPH